MQNVSTPDEAYKAFWIYWSVAALAGSLVVGALFIVASRIWLVMPIVQAIESLKR